MCSVFTFYFSDFSSALFLTSDVPATTAESTTNHVILNQPFGGTDNEPSADDGLQPIINCENGKNHEFAFHLVCTAQLINSLLDIF